MIPGLDPAKMLREMIFEAIPRKVFLAFTLTVLSLGLWSGGMTAAVVYLMWFR